MKVATKSGWTVALLGRALVAWGSASCAPDDLDAVVARDATDLVAHEGDLQLLTAALLGGTSGSLTLASAPLAGSVELAEIGDGARSFFFPGGCLTTTHALATRTVSYVFKDCGGPFGLRTLSGTVAIVYTKVPTGLDLAVKSESLRIGRASLQFTARAVIVAPSATSAERKATWHAEISGTSARDKAITRVADRTLTFSTGESCVEEVGRSTGTVAGAALEVVVEKMRRCRGACPEPGGRIVATAEGRPPLELTFDGTTEARMTIDGKPRTITLACAK